MAQPSWNRDENSLPVFVFPSSLAFYCNDPQSLKQILTLYNPYDFSIKFKVLSTAPRKYNVIEPEGSIKARSCLDITIRLVDTSISNVLKEDQFRVQMRRENKISLVGKRDIPAILWARKEDGFKEDKEGDIFEQINSSFSSTGKPLKSKRMDESFDSISITSRLNQSDNSKTHVFYIFAAAVCGLILCLPSGEKESRIPQYLHVTATVKIIVAYILGLITSIICKYT